MGKKLSEMSLEELWQLFPIFLVEYNESWKQWFLAESLLIKEILPAKGIKRIEHIGSTAVEGIWSKPIIDILIELSKDQDMKILKDLLVQKGYICMSEDSSRISLNKGYTESGFAERVFHIHLRYEGDNDELYFRDYLIDIPKTAKEYESLKLSLWKEFEHDRDAYTGRKSDFIREHTNRAKEKFGFRYS